MIYFRSVGNASAKSDYETAAWQTSVPTQSSFEAGPKCLLSPHARTDENFFFEEVADEERHNIRFDYFSLTTENAREESIL